MIPAILQGSAEALQFARERLVPAAQLACNPCVPPSLASKVTTQQQPCTQSPEAARAPGSALQQPSRNLATWSGDAPSGADGAGGTSQAEQRALVAARGLSSPALPRGASRLVIFRGGRGGSGDSLGTGTYGSRFSASIAPNLSGGQGLRIAPAPAVAPFNPVDLSDRPGLIGSLSSGPVTAPAGRSSGAGGGDDDRNGGGSRGQGSGNSGSGNSGSAGGAQQTSTTGEMRELEREAMQLAQAALEQARANAALAVAIGSVERSIGAGGVLSGGLDGLELLAEGATGIGAGSEAGAGYTPFTRPRLPVCKSGRTA